MHWQGGTQTLSYLPSTHALALPPQLLPLSDQLASIYLCRYVGHEEGGQLTKLLKESPDAVVLLDEVRPQAAAATVPMRVPTPNCPRTTCRG